jgi:hypothetical protein
MQSFKFSMITFSFPRYSASLFLISTPSISLILRSLVTIVEEIFVSTLDVLISSFFACVTGYFLAKANFFFGIAVSFSLAMAVLRVSNYV